MALALAATIFSMLANPKLMALLATWIGLTASSVAGQTPPPTPQLAISGPATIPLYTLGQYVVSGDPTAKVAWLVMPTTSQVVSGQSLVMTGPSGAYTVIAFAVAAGQPVILQQTVTIASGPGPGPGPTPGPSTKGPFYVAFVTDRTSTIPLTPALTALQTSSTVWPALKAINTQNQWGAVDISATTFAPWKPDILSTPTVLVIGTNPTTGLGFKVETFTPVDEPGVIAEVTRLANGGAPK